MAGRCVWPCINVRTPARCIVAMTAAGVTSMISAAVAPTCIWLPARSFAAEPPTCVEAQVTEHPLRDGIAQDPAQALVTRVGRAEHIAMHQHDPLTVQVDDRAVAQELAAGLRGKALADQKIAVAMHEIAGNAAVGESTQGRHDFAHGRVRIVVAEPRLEQVAEDV